MAIVDFLPLQKEKSHHKLQDVRRLMVEEGLDALIVVNGDRHGTSYEPGESDKRIGFLTGFTDSGATTCAITARKAALWVYGLASVKAVQVIDTETWDLVADSVDLTPGIWLLKNCAPGSKVGFDPETTTAEQYLSFLDTSQMNLRMSPTHVNIVDHVWSNRPPPMNNPVFSLPESVTGASTPEKLAILRKHLTNAGFPGGIVVTQLDEVAWLLNLRGTDMVHNSEFYAFMIVGKDSAAVYMDPRKLRRVDPSLLSRCPGMISEVLAPDHLETQDVITRSYEDFLPDARTFASRCSTGDTPFFVDTRISMTLMMNLTIAMGILKEDETSPLSPAVIRQVAFSQISPLQRLKSVKNPVELEGVRSCHLRDCTAAIEFFAWIEQEIEHRFRNGDPSLSELECAEKVEQLRRLQAGYISNSFASISAYARNTSLPTAPSPTRNLSFETSGPYVHVSGAHYPDGTTASNFSRVFFYQHPRHPRAPTQHEKLVYTAVLRSFISLSSLVFPVGTTGYQIDSIARRPLWDLGLESTSLQGHGVGVGTCVVEGPHGIGSSRMFDRVPFKEGNVVTIEPAVYVEGDFGYRLENVTVVSRAKHNQQFTTGEEWKEWLTLKAVDFLPIETDLIDVNAMPPDEKQWLNDYHALVQRTMLEALELYGSKGKAGVATETVRAWLKKKTAPI
ncbi:Creatinase/aminopeptidase [Gonapodya prolifera JEL478]|uniref:Creatinase/aminopeptidase n=1 Tax=Gonapodya prolifera (strain JEL478) TaxID=1344416 RepID=A0A139A3G3_GONPJ|nr:Creatinase/aminopeptidase [Gonapodya prolifera JEL478]|eukprot:KXS11158.1 Creatinase/aminopeptidase [Gonapodya prolifera JEL478]